MDIAVPCGKLWGRTAAPPSKSLSHRFLIAAALAGEGATVRHPLLSDDVKITLAALSQLGFPHRNENGAYVFDDPEPLAPPQPRQIWVGNSGTTARFITALAAWRGWPCRIDGSERMQERPMAPLIRALQSLGAKIHHRNYRLPLEIAPGHMRGGRVTVDASASSQFLSALLLVAPLLPEGLAIEHHGVIASRPYARMTVAVMRKCGIRVTEKEGCYRVAGNQRYKLDRVNIEADYSAASYFLAGAVISGGQVEIPELVDQSLQGDRVILEILEQMGAAVSWQGECVAARRTAALQGGEWNCNDCPDLVPTLAVTALFARGETILTNIGHLRHKESDRVAAIVENIRRLGGEAQAGDRHLRIIPRPLTGTALPAYDDHRIAMSFALAGLRVPGVVIQGAESVQKSYPQFWENFLSHIKQ